MTKRKFDPATRRTGETLASSTYAALRRDIISGAIPAASQLRIRHLCERYGVGFSPIREALNRLVNEGLVRQVDLRGFNVAPLSRDELEEITRTRCWLNELALRKSIERGDAAWEETIVVAFHRLSRISVNAPAAADADNGDDAASRPNPENEAAHRAFHASLISACDSSWLLGFCEQLFDQSDRYRRLATPSVRQERQHDEHRLIMEAVLAREVDKAVTLMNRHVQRTAELGYVALDEARSTTRAPSPAADLVAAPADG
jgi:GntR family transcriptional regulator, carbon starvation induced regulator